MNNVFHKFLACGTIELEILHNFSKLYYLERIDEFLVSSMIQRQKNLLIVIYIYLSVFTDIDRSEHGNLWLRL